MTGFYRVDDSNDNHGLSNDRSCREYLKMLLFTGFHKGTHPPSFWHDVSQLPYNCTKNQAATTWSLITSNTHTFDWMRFADQNALLTALKIDICDMCDIDRVNTSPLQNAV